LERGKVKVKEKRKGKGKERGKWEKDSFKLEIWGKTQDGINYTAVCLMTHDCSRNGTSSSARHECGSSGLTTWHLHGQ